MADYCLCGKKVCVLNMCMYLLSINETVVVNESVHFNRSPTVGVSDVIIIVVV